MNEQEKKQQRIYDFLNAKTKPKFLCLPYTKQKEFFLQKKELYKEKGEWRTKKNKKRIFNLSRYGY